MKKRRVLPGLILVIGLILAACNPQATDTDVMSDSNQESNAEVMIDVNDDSITESKSDQMSEDMEADDDMSTHNDDSMKESEDEMMDKEGKGMEMVDEEMSNDDGMGGNDSDMSGNDETSMKDDIMSKETMMTPAWFDATLTNARTGEEFSISDLKGKVILVETMAMWCSNCFKQQGQVIALHKLIGERDDFISLGIDIDPNENAEALKSYINKNGFDWHYTVAPIEVAREIGQLYGNQFLNPPSTPMLIIDGHGEVHLLPFGIKSAENLLESLQPFLDGSM